jgi:xanthine/CO dehydrogenase XdhC/CoxF family maturation factor
MEIAVSVMAEIIKASNYKNSFPAKLCAKLVPLGGGVHQDA